MNNKINLIIVCLLSLLICASAQAYAEIYVISHSGTTLSESDIKDVFLGSKQFSDSTKLVPVDNSGAQEEFVTSVLKMNARKYSTAWTKKSFRDGINPPAVKSGDTDVLNFVKNTPGAVGYVTSAPSGVNVLKKY
ncbi:MAG: phosphate ABC transporter substrate-binding protein [Nitrospira sp.]|nr:phosphate ABC transporter substrate-binding protein [bacterium]MBL7050160.1 phosphate ABC transporter substrate-binding protein [Nitrospira sp.]